MTIKIVYLCYMQTFMFISGVEIAFVMFVAVLIFGADKIPDIARGLGKGMKTLRNATDEIKNEVTKSASKQGIDTSITKSISKDFEEVKKEVEEVTGAIKRNL